MVGTARDGIYWYIIDDAKDMYCSVLTDVSNTEYGTIML